VNVKLNKTQAAAIAGAMEVGGVRVVYASETTCQALGRRGLAEWRQYRTESGRWVERWELTDAGEGFRTE
jgi:hypothetical protein